MTEQSDSVQPASTTTANPLSTVLSELEIRVARIWADGLERADDIGADDNFFDLGGDSLSMTIVLFQVGDQFGVDLPQTALLEATSLRQFCAAIELARSESKA